MHLDKVICTSLLGDYFIYGLDEPRGHVFVCWTYETSF